MDPRVSVSAVSSWRQPFDADRALWDRLGVDRVGLSLRKCEEHGLEAAAQATADDGRSVSNFVECGWLDLHDPASWQATTERWHAAIDAFAGFAPWSLVLTTGAAWQLAWDDAAAALAEATASVRAHAVANGVSVALENTGSLRVDLSFVHRLADAVDLAAMLDTGVTAELSSCWAERGIDELLHDSRIVHVQLSDFVVGSLATPDRAVPGDGDIPLRRLLRALDRAGYAGAYEIEMVGPRIEDEGYERAIARAMLAVDALLAE